LESGGRYTRTISAFLLTGATNGIQAVKRDAAGSATDDQT
jgi:hypothetical protein